MDCPHSTPEPWQECRNPNRPILAAEVEWKGGRFAGNQGTGRAGVGAFGTLCGIRFPRSLPSGIVGRLDPGFVWDENALGNDGYYEVFLYMYL
jgi:hypothetical protein